MYLTKYILKRLFWGIVSLACVLFITFALVKMLKIENPLDIVSAQIQERRNEALGYNKPIVVQFWLWIKNLIMGNFGTSLYVEKLTPVFQIIKRRLIPTLALNVYCEILIVPLGILLGIYAAVKKNKWQDYTISTGIMVFMTLPTFVMCFFWLFVLSFKLQWTPLLVYSLNEAGGQFTFKMIYSMIPPILALSLGGIASLSRSIRAELTDQIETDYMLLARAKGLTYRQAIFKHSLKNAFIPVFPSIIVGFIAMLGGSFSVETIFGIPGIGRLTIQSLNPPDYDVFMACEAFYGVVNIFASIIYDISFGIIDPRIKMGAR